MKRYWVLLALLVGLSLALPASPSYAADSWLDHPIENWNAPGYAVPGPEGEEWFADEVCLVGARPPETFEDFQLTDLGWHLVGSYQGGWGIVIVTATLGYDGMCRPMGYQQFVFVDGLFAGTISPELMYSRSDGAGWISSFYGPELLQATFIRYADEDPLCCPSLPETYVSYQVIRSDFGPVLVPVFPDSP